MNSLIFTNSSSASLDDTNGNVKNLMGTIVPTTTQNNDEDSLSLSEYTDNEKSAPTELLAEFLTSIMRKDYVNALKYCKLNYEPNNKTAKDFYPQLLAKVNEQNSTSSDGSDENCNYTNSLEFFDNEILDNDNVDGISMSSSNDTSSISSNDEEGSDLNSIDEEIDQRDQEDLIASLSHSSSRSSNLSKSDQLPESMSSDSSNRENTSNSFSFASLLLDDPEDLMVNNDPPLLVPPAEPVPVATPASPFTTKIMQMFKSKWEGSPSKN